ncbi:Peptide N-acetyl-beta-D-glucosaminyl asparaginase amidase A [Terriglobus roseus DSM 18391]|uniref:Peptide N-acetyl-beta-D-glucosaminyl asparaginase amidase A n=1 Tax=Terriglobus roseus (strain DSM 18391 / NRRL B-41598 / KBS 63) TaxID=926566 RepID=I3ZL27_TERRK|nr:peptide-N4-asparagine amidase [Terriglobus roseus]AFL89945.1 Peptide N-acetyl-beta-D-glucosaminyl asparaginase amidase A [Terriglobus roseus DSM 18391]
MPRILCRPLSLQRCVLAASLTFAVTAAAQVVTVDTKPVVGSSNPATAEPPVTRPTSAPCTVTLFDNQVFKDYSAKPLTYAPPTGCRGHWAKVVLTVDFTVTAGRQFDRTASLYLGNANIFYGTTAEPRAALSPSWHVERDVTDLSALLKTSQSGQAIVYNVVDSTYTGIIYGTAKLLFYPADFRNPPAVVPDVVIPVSGTNSPYELDTTSSQLTTSVVAPRNTVKAYLDVIAQSQSSDEFWYLCAPNDVAAKLQSCPSTAFRETEITIDGKPAGVAPVYPWIYTGGIDPYLWEPIVGVQTLNFKPYRVDLTPFAGVLSDGAPHTVGVSVYNATSYFLATANLLLYTDPFRAQTGGGLLENTLSLAPTPLVVEKLTTDASGTTTGTVTVDSARTFTVKGYVNSALGRVETTVEQKVNFNSAQTFNVGTNDIQNAVQTSTVSSKTTSQLGFLKETTDKQISFPLTLNYAYTVNNDGTSAQVVTSDQKDVETETKSINGLPIFGSSRNEVVHTTDTLNYSAAGALVSATPTSASATYKAEDTLGKCFSRQVTSTARAVTNVTDGAGCPVKR